MRRVMILAFLLCCTCLFGCSEALPEELEQLVPLLQDTEKLQELQDAAAPADKPTGGEEAYVGEAVPVPTAARMEEPISPPDPTPTLATDTNASVSGSSSGAAEDAQMNAAAPDYEQLALEALGIVAEDVRAVRVTYLTQELFSCVVELNVGGGIELQPYTYSLETGESCKLGDFFLESSTGWRSLLPDLVTADALNRGMTLLGEVPPVMEEHPFYIENGSIVLLYRPYEITTYEAGSPQFVLDMNEIAAYTNGAYGVGDKP